MSSVPRIYKSTRLSGRTRRHRALGCLPALLVASALLAVWTAWVTRDAYPTHRFIAADRTYEIYATDFLNKRARLAEAKLWNLLPGDLPLAVNFAALSQKLEMPAWVLNNVAYSTFHVSGRDLERFSDPLLITRMSRVGCLLERFQRFSADVLHDSAGGLNLRVIEDGELYYAVRGRILLVSSDRDALIRALTLTPEQCAQTAVGTDDAAAGTGSASPDVHVRIRPADESALGALLERAEVGLYADGAAARFECRVKPGPAYRARLAPLLADTKPAKLLRPAEGLLALSGNFEHALPSTWHALRSVLADSGGLASTLDALGRFAGKRQDALQDTFGPLLGSAGSAWTLTWHGFDLQALLPAPQFTGFALGDAAVFNALREVTSPLPEGAHVWPAEAFLLPGAPLIAVPMPEGPAFTPAAAHTGELLVLGVGQSTLAEVAAASKRSYLEFPGNLHAECAPTPLVAALHEAALELAAAGLLQGETPESVESRFAFWRSAAERIERATLTASNEAPDIQIVIDLDLANDAPNAPTE